MIFFNNCDHNLDDPNGRLYAGSLNRLAVHDN